MKSSLCPGCGSHAVQTREHIAAATVMAGYASPALGIPLAAESHAQPASWAFVQCGDCDLRWYADAPAGDGPFYEALLQHPWYYQADKAEYGFAAAQVQPGERVLEVGCGRGAFRRHLPGDVHYRGLEFNQEALRLAQAAGLDVVLKPVAQEAAESPGGYDVVCHFQVLEHVEDPAGFMAACAQALRPGGRLIVAVPAEDSFIGMAESSWLNMPPHHLSRWTDRALSAAFERVGVTPGAMWHEPVAELHEAWRRNVLANAGWLDLWGLQPATVARPGINRLGRLAMRLPGLRGWLHQRATAAYPHAARGHSVCLVGVKRGAV